MTSETHMWDNPASCGLTPRDVFALIGGVALMQNPDTGEIRNERNVMLIMDLTAFGWVTLMNRREACDILLTGSVQDVLRTLSFRVSRKLAAV